MQQKMAAVVFAYIRSKQNVRDNVGPLEDSAANIITLGFLNGGIPKWLFQFLL